ncbi:amino acid adenylation domain-containing protein, partial [Methylopila musalis]
PRPPARGLGGASRPIEVPAALADAVKALARQEGVTPFTLMLAAYHVLLGRLSGQERVAVGSRASGRLDPGFNDVVGYFVNPFVVGVELNMEAPFRAFLAHAHATVLDAMERQAFPFPLIVERLRPKRDPSVTALFQASFVLQKAQRSGGALDLLAGAKTGETAKLGPLTIEYYDIRQQEGQFDLDLELIDAGGVFWGWLKYDPALFDADTVDRFGAHYIRLLESVVADPATPIGRLDLLTEADRRFLADRNPAPEPLPAPPLVHRAFEARAAETPDAVALTFEDEEVTYGDLNARANRLAHHLIAKGVRPDDLVALCAERSIEMVVGILGVTKAGGAYVPLDPASPKDRLAFIIGDSAAKLVVTQDALAGLFEGTGAEVVRIDADGGEIATRPASNPEPALTGSSLAYVIYTSGTTGRPKGVLVEHGNVARLFQRTAHWYRFGPDDVWLLFHSFAFDVSVWELWGALAHGGSIVIAPFLVTRSPAETLKLIARHNVTVLNQSPSAFRLLAPEEGRRPLPEPLSLRLIIFAGEALDLQSLRPWFERYGDQRPTVVNMYGITETTVHSSYRVVRAPDLDRPRSAIGVPIPDLQLRLLDPRGLEVPIGVAGEIHVGGPGVTRGYHERGELTAARYLPDPFTDDSTARLYRSGDLARYLPDGDIEYLGRIDKQVKIRGFRIELGEIEATLADHPGVSGAVVAARDGGAGGQRLVAYIVPAGDEAPSASDLRAHVSARLPDYMVPSAFVAIAAVPLTGNGKLDHAALPEPSGEGAGAGVPPRDAVEQRLAAMWEKLLGARDVGVRDDFFERGGHSLLAVHLMAEIERAYGVELPISTLFQNPTIEQLAERLRSGEGELPWSPLVPIRVEGDEAPFFCVAGGGGNVLYYQRLAAKMPRSRPFYGLQLRGVDGRSEPLTSVEAIAEECVAAIRAVQPAGPYRLGGHCFGGLVAFEIAQQLMRQGETVERLAILDAPAPRDEAGRLNTIEADDDAVWLAKVGSVLAEDAGTDLGIREEDLRPLPEDERYAYVKAKLQAAGLMPSGDAVAQIRGFLRVFVANSRMRYAPENPRPVPLALFRAATYHPDYDYSAADDDGADVASSTLGWRAFAAGPVAVAATPGTHVTMLSEPQVGHLADRLAQFLD